MSAAPWEQARGSDDVDADGYDVDPEPWRPWRSHRYQTLLLRSRRAGWLWKVAEEHYTERGWGHDMACRSWSWAPTQRWGRWRARRETAWLREVRRQSNAAR